MNFLKKEEEKIINNIYSYPLKLNPILLKKIRFLKNKYDTSIQKIIEDLLEAGLQQAEKLNAFKEENK